jgi:hypothetical protein
MLKDGKANQCKSLGTSKPKVLNRIANICYGPRETDIIFNQIHYLGNCNISNKPLMWQEGTINWLFWESVMYVCHQRDTRHQQFCTTWYLNGKIVRLECGWSWIRSLTGSNERLWNNTAWRLLLSTRHWEVVGLELESSILVGKHAYTRTMVLVS